MLESLIITGVMLLGLRAIPEAFCAVCQLFAKPATHDCGGWRRIDQ